MSKVCIVRVKDNVISCVSSAMEGAKWYDFIPEGCDVSLKVNLGWDLFLPGTVTSPLVVEGVIKTIYSHVSKIYIVESGQVLVNVEKAVRKTKILDLCKKYDKVSWVNLSKVETVKMKVESLNMEIEIPNILLNTQIITIPVMKTHGRTTISGAIKNQWGCLKELRHNYHPILNEMLYEINKILDVKFAVMDGTICLEGAGPKSGIPKKCDLILASNDILAIDIISAKIMGFDEEKIEHIKYFAKQSGFKKQDIEVVGEDINKIKYNFKHPKNNLVASGEIFLRNSFLKKIVFETRIFNLFCLIAKLYYFVWYYIISGRKYKNKILKDEFYGKQWK